MASRWTKLVAAGLAGAAFVVPLAWSLQSRVPGSTYAPLWQPPPGIKPSPVSVLGRARVEMDGAFFVYQSRLHTGDPARLAAHQEIRLFVTNVASSARLKDGLLTIEGTSCTYRTAAGAKFPRELASLAFGRDPGCAPLNGTPTGVITVRLRFDAVAHPALWAYFSDDENVSPDVVTISRFGFEAPVRTLIAHGTLVDRSPESGATRAALLAYVWDLSPAVTWIFVSLIGCAMLIAGAVLLAWGPPGSSPARHAARRGGAAFMAALALAAAYAVIVPPFQAADEPNHFLALAAYAGRPALGGEAADWARRGAFEEIRFHADRPFSPLDRGRPGERWSAIGVPDEIRGAGMRAVWWPMAPLVRRLAPARAFLAMRLFHAILFAGAVALFVILVSAFTSARVPELLAIPLFLVPTLPYFGMHMSNYAPLVDLWVILAAGVAIAAWDGPRAHAAGPLLGAALAGAIAFSRSALPVAPFVASLLAARIVLGDRLGRRQSAVVHWIGFGVALALGLALTDDRYLQGLGSGGADVTASAATIAFVLRHAWLLLVPCAIALGLEILVTRVRGGSAADRGPSVSAAYLATILAIVLFVALAASIWIEYPMLHPFDPNNRPPALDYVRRVVLACLTFLRFGRPDNLTSISFFGGFGWLETLAPEWLVSVLAGASGVALVLLLAWIARTGSGRALVWLLCAVAGFALSAAAYGLTIIKAMPADLHGRYLLGLYLCVLVIAWSAAARIANDSSPRRLAWIAAIIGASSLGVHVFCLTFILKRYF
jgi:hypothetical protein